MRLLPGSSYSCCIRNLHALVHKQCHPVHIATAHEICDLRINSATAALHATLGTHLDAWSSFTQSAMPTPAIHHCLPLRQSLYDEGSAGLAALRAEGLVSEPHFCNGTALSVAQVG
jgi:hypothetical protein